MAKFYHSDILDYGLNKIKDLCAGNVDMLLIKAYTQGDSYATVNSNSVAAQDMVTGDFTLGDQGTYGRQLTVGAKSPTATGDSGGSPDLHIAIVDVTNSAVLAVTDETTDQQIYTGNTVNIPSFDLKMNQPT
jgi:hypothetical protein